VAQHFTESSLNFVFIGLSITSSWGNGHATTYRSLIKGLHQRGHRVTFLECDRPWYADNRDAAKVPYCTTHLYEDVVDLTRRFREQVRSADVVVVGSYTADGIEVSEWVQEEATGIKAFYDIDTPITLARLQSGACEYLNAELIPGFDLMLSFTGGPTLDRLESHFGAQRARALYCSVDVEQYRPLHLDRDIDLGYMGTYSDDRQLGVEELLNGPARRLSDRRFMVVGSQYPQELNWPSNVERISHLPPGQHARFYSRQRCTLNITRADMRAAGYSPSVRLFEAAACATPIISDEWPGIEDVLMPNIEVMIARSSQDVIEYLERDASELRRVGLAAHERVLDEHCSSCRAIELERYVEEAQLSNVPTELRKAALAGVALTR
jgi:spore maturation protein CgeB